MEIKTFKAYLHCDHKKVPDGYEIYFAKKRGCSFINIPTSPMSTLMIIAIQLADEQLHSLNKVQRILGF